MRRFTRIAARPLQWATATLLVLVATGTGAQAQPAPWQPERTSPGWVFTPAIGFGGMWDSNSTVRATGDPQIGQWVGVVNPRGEFDYNGRRTKFTAGYSGSLEAYNKLDELTKYEQRGRLQLRYEATPRLQFTTTSGLSVSPTTERIDLGSLPFENVGTTLFTSRSGAEYALTRRTSLIGEYEFQTVNFDNTERFNEDILSGGHSHGVAGTLRVALTERLATGGSYTFRRAFTDGGLQNVDVSDALGIVSYRLAEHTAVSAGAGFAHLYLSATGETRNGPSLRASISQSVSRIQAELSFDRSYIPSWTFGGTTTNQEVRGNVFMPLADGRVTLRGSLSYRQTEPLLTLGERISLDTWAASSSIGYAIVRWLQVEGFYSASFQDSSARGEVDRTRVGVQFVTLKPMRIQ